MSELKKRCTYSPFFVPNKEKLEGARIALELLLEELKKWSYLDSYMSEIEDLVKEILE